MAATGENGGHYRRSQGLAALPIIQHGRVARAGIAEAMRAMLQFLLKGLFSGGLGGFPPRSKKAVETLLGQAGAASWVRYRVFETR